MRSHLRTPLKRVRGLGSAKHGTGAFVIQRLTAIALVPLFVWFVWLALSMLHDGYAAAHTMVAHPANAVLMAAFSIALFWHAQLGLQVVIEDYVHTRWLEFILQALVRFLAILGVLACLLAIARIALGS